jgi:hypothetical protein
MEPGLPKMPEFLSKRSKVRREQHIESTMENEIIELESMKAHKHLDVEDSRNIKHKDEKVEEGVCK